MTLPPNIHCEDCAYYHVKNSECRRYFPREGKWPHVEGGEWCGEWGEKTSESKELLKSLIPSEMLKEHPWLLEPIPYTHIGKVHLYKQSWSYAWHAYIFLRRSKRFGVYYARDESTLVFLARDPKRPVKAPEKQEAHNRCKWMLRNLADLFPTMI